MRSALPSTCAILAATSLLGWTCQAEAQSTFRPRQPSTSMHNGVMQVEGSRSQASDLTTDQIQVELALLSEPTTFAYHLSTHRAGDKLEIRGYVPNEAIHQRALLLANRSSLVAVVDAIQVHPHLSAKQVVVPANDLLGSATALLKKEFGEEAKQMELTARANGQITVSGTVSSLSAKLAVSQTMRRVVGCACVLNQLAVPKLVATTNFSNSQTIQPAGSSVSYPSAPVGKLNSVWKPVKTVVFPSKETITPLETVNIPAVVPPKRALRAKTELAADKPPIAPSKHAEENNPSRPADASVKQAVNKEDNDIPKTPLAVESTPNQDRESHVPLTEPKPLPNLLPKDSKPTPIQAASIVTIKQPPLCERVKEKIEALCGLKGKNVEVTLVSEKNLNISLDYPDKDEAQHLSEGILQLRELAPYEVSLDIHILMAADK